MARNFIGSGDSIIVMAPGGAANLHTGAHTVLVYFKTAGPNAGLIQLRAGGNPSRSVLVDTNVLFCDGDFTGGPTVSAGTYIIGGYSKASSSAAVRWHFWNGTTSWSHQDGSTHGDGTGPIDEIWIGKAYNRMSGDIAVAALWDVALADATVEAASLETHLQGWHGLSPVALWALNQASTSDPVLDIEAGNADQTSITGTTPGISADPPGFDYTLGSTGTLDLAAAAATATAAASSTSTGTLTASAATATATASATAASTSTLTAAASVATLAATANATATATLAATAHAVTLRLSDGSDTVVPRPSTGTVSRPDTGTVTVPRLVYP